MLVADMMKDEGDIFIKSEWNLFTQEWNCLSYTKKSVGEYLRVNFEVGRDILVYVGTSTNETANPVHRQRLLSAVIIEPKQVIGTRDILQPDVWEKSVQNYGADRWAISMPVIRAANFVGPPFPSAHEIIPESYAQLGIQSNRGKVVKVNNVERDKIRNLKVEEMKFTLSERVKKFMDDKEAMIRNYSSG